jgi:hypothetical protein
MGMQAPVEGYEARKSRLFCKRIGAVLVCGTDYLTSWYTYMHRNDSLFTGKASYTNLTLKECLKGKCTVAKIQGNSTFFIRHSIKKLKQY